MSEVRRTPASGTAATGVEQFLDQARQVRPSQPVGALGRLILAMDATMSRQPTWDRAQALQAEMFAEAARTSGLEVQLVYFRGFNECRASKWLSRAEAVTALMTKVDCQGGHTQIGRVLKHVRGEASRGRVNAAVLVGDAVEEDIDGLCQLAGELGLLNVPLFMFLEGADRGAERAFREMARLSRGAFHRFDLSSAAALAQLLRAAAAYAAGGQAALKELSGRGSGVSQILLEQLK